jgi:hypothetical protein
MNELPNQESIIEGFVNRHFLRRTELLEAEGATIYWVDVTNILIHEAYSSLPNQVLVSEPTIGILLNMLDRIFQHVDGALLSFVTGAPASSEVSARAALEAAVNVLYILSGDTVLRVEAYINNYFDNVDKQIKLWHETTSHMTYEKAKVHLKAIENRHKANNEMKKIFSHANAQMKELKGVTGTENWPSRIVNRFEALGLSDTYRTVYARLSSEAHNDAEETLRYVLAVLSNNQGLKESMGIETLNFSKMMIYYAASYYVRTAITYAEVFQMPNILKHLMQGHTIIQNQLENISKLIGSGL